MTNPQTTIKPETKSPAYFIYGSNYKNIYNKSQQLFKRRYQTMAQTMVDGNIISCNRADITCRLQRHHIPLHGFYDNVCHISYYLYVCILLLCTRP